MTTNHKVYNYSSKSKAETKSLSDKLENSVLLKVRSKMKVSISKKK